MLLLGSDLSDFSEYFRVIIKNYRLFHFPLTLTEVKGDNVTIQVSPTNPNVNLHKEVLTSLWKLTLHFLMELKKNSSLALFEGYCCLLLHIKL